MNILRHTARLAMSALFVSSGVDALRNPQPKADAAEDVAHAIGDRIPGLDDADTETLIRLNAGVQVGAGALLAINRLPRPAAAALAASLMPTTAAAHRFWELDGQERRQQMLQFLKNAAIWGGLVIAAMDTEGEPGVAWRTKHALEHAEREAEHRKEVAGLHAELAREHARARAAELQSKAVSRTADARVKTAETKARVAATTRRAAKDAKLAKKVAAKTGGALAAAGRATSNAAAAGGSMAVKGVKALTPA